jgi:hypothetical protein
MNDPSIVGAPAAVAQNIDKIVQVESKALQPRSISEALTSAIGAFSALSHSSGFNAWAAPAGSLSIPEESQAGVDILLDTCGAIKE